jgi:hypothetical protein
VTCDFVVDGWTLNAGIEQSLKLFELSLKVP